MPWDKLLIAALAGGAALFVWNAIVWMALPHHLPDFRRLVGAKGVEDAMRSAGVTPGFYQIPHMHDFEKGWKDPALAERFRRGPNALLVVSPPGPCMGASQFVMGFVLGVLQALAGAIVLHVSAGTIHGLPRTVLFFAGLGLLVNGTGHLTQAVWMQFPWRHSIKCTVDGAVGYALMGLVFHWIAG